MMILTEAHDSTLSGGRFGRPGGRGSPRRCLKRPALMLLSIAIACGSGPRASAEDRVAGTALDANTKEPIVGAWIFQVEGHGASGADVPRIDRVEMTRTDAEGRFAFERRSGPRFFGHFFGRSDDPRYVFYHPSYGLVRAHASPDGRQVRFRPSLRDAHLRQADATLSCTAPRRDALARKLSQLACPPGVADRFPNGRPRAEGPLDEHGRRTGSWIFHREDGSVIARGEYRAGAAVGAWQFEPPAPSRVETD